MRKALLSVLLLVGVALTSLTVFSWLEPGTPLSAAVCNTTVPRGAIAPAVPEWCAQPLGAIDDTHVEAANAWLDDFNHGDQHAAMGGPSDAYQINNIGVPDAIFFRHNDHWMVDQQGPTDQGHSMMRPKRTFTRQPDGSLVVEVEVADAGGGPDVWPEVTVTHGASPTTNDLYTYEAFGDSQTFGCRLQEGGFPICEYRRNGGRVFEASFFQTDHAATSFGGYPEAAPGAWRTCNATQDPDVLCRNTFRLTLRDTSFRIDVNGQRFFEQTGVPSMAGLLGSPMYVYQSNSLWRVGGIVFRSHWDHFAVNPALIGDVTPTPTTTVTPTPTVVPTPTPTATGTPSATPTASPTPSPTATPTPTGTPTATVTATPTATPTPRLCRVRGSKPVGETGWTTERWYLVDCAIFKN